MDLSDDGSTTAADGEAHSLLSDFGVDDGGQEVVTKADSSDDDNTPSRPNTVAIHTPPLQLPDVFDEVSVNIQDESNVKRNLLQIENRNVMQLCIHFLGPPVHRSCTFQASENR